MTGEVMEGDVSKNTIIVLVILTLAVSMIGTWAVLEEISSVQPIGDSQAPQGQISLKIGQPGDFVTEGPVVATGNVAFAIIQPQ